MLETNHLGKKGIRLAGHSLKYISKIDFDRLNEAVNIAREVGEGRNIVLGRLKKALQEAKIVPVEKMPKKVVTMCVVSRHR